MKPQHTAIVAYITPIGLIVAFILHWQQRSYFAAFHLRQALGIYLGAFLINAAISFFLRLPLFGYLFYGVTGLVELAVIVFAIFGIIAAYNMQEKELPLIGKYFEKWFSSLR